MVGRSIQNQTVGIAQLHAGNHTTHLLSSRKYADFLHHFFAGEQHTAQIAFHFHLIALSVLAQPVHQVQVAVEIIGVVQWQVSRGNGYPPVIMSGLCLAVAVDNLEQSRHGTRVAAQEHNLVALLYREVHVVEEHRTLFRFGTQARYLQNLVARFAVHRKDDARILA